MADWGTSHAGTGNEKPSVVEATLGASVWLPLFHFVDYRPKRPRSECQAPLHYLYSAVHAADYLLECHGPGMETRAHGSTCSLTLKEGLGALPHSQLPCPVVKWVAEVPGGDTCFNKT